jgi:UDP-3-O-[3-hydroxymyristoyl] glucosamine N-acyltransferase
MKKTLSEIAQLIDGRILGDSEIEISGVNNIDDAIATEITFAVPPHLDKAAACLAGAVIVPENISVFAKPVIVVANPRVAFTKLLEIFTPKIRIEKGIHSSAIIGRSVNLGQNVTIMPQVVIADGVSIGDNAIIYPHTYIGQEVSIGSETTIYPNVTIREHCKIGQRVILHSGAVIGSDGFGFVTVQNRHQKVPQIGNVVIEDDVEVGANTTIDRATTGSTIVKRGTKIDNLVHLAHNVVVGENCFFVAQTGIAGSTQIGNNVTFAGQTGCNGHLNIGDNSVFAARSAPISDVPPGSFLAGFPARPHKEWLRSEAAMHKVPGMLKKIRALEKRLLELEEKDGAV